MTVVRRDQQSGAVLIVALVFMLILAIIGGASMQNATLQERMAGNSKDLNIAFQAAEIAIRGAEEVMKTVKVGDFTGDNGLYLSCPDPDDNSKACSEPSWQDRESTGWRVVAEEVAMVSRQPEFFIEQMSAFDDPDAPLDADKTVSLQGYYRVTSRGFGLNDRSVIVLTTTYRRKEE